MTKCSKCQMPPSDHIYYVFSSGKMCAPCFANYAMSLLRRFAHGEDVGPEIIREFKPW